MKRRGMVATLVATMIVAVTIVLACGRWTITSEATRAGLLGGVERATGMQATADGPVSLRFLPRPTIQLDNVSLRGMGGAIALDADGMKGRLDVLGLLGGHLRVASARFENPTATLDLDQLKPIIDALTSRPPSRVLLSLMHTAGLTVHNGVIHFRSSDAARDTLLTDVSGTLEWRDDDAEARLNATATWHGVSGEVVVDIDRPGDLATGGQSLASVRLKSPLLEVGGEGSLLGEGDIRAVGRITASTPDLPALLRSIGEPMPGLAAVQEAGIHGNATMTADTLAFDNVALSLDDLAFDGAIAVRRNRNRTGIAGTLATDRIDLNRFLGVLPPVLAADGGWSTAPLGPSLMSTGDIDLRVSMEKATLGPLTLEDGSLSLQSGDGRTELSLGEVRAYDGLLKGRIVATREGGVVDVRADATMARLDLSRLARDLPDNLRAIGSLTGHVALDGRGASTAALMTRVNGRGEFDLRGGEIGGALARAILDDPGAATGGGIAVEDGSGPFDNAVVTFAANGGVVTLGDSWIAWPNARAVLTGTASLSEQRLALHSSVTGEDTRGPDSDYTLTGPWQALRLAAAPSRF